MNRWIKRSLLGTGALLAAAAGTLAYAVHHADGKMTRTLRLPDHPIALRDDDAAIARGRYLY